MFKSLKNEGKKLKVILKDKIDGNKSFDLSVSEAKELILDEDVILIDVRTIEELGSIKPIKKDALHIDYYGDYKPEIDKLDRDNPYLVYCAAGVRSRAVVNYMKEKEFQNVFNLEGGVKAWYK